MHGEVREERGVHCCEQGDVNADGSSRPDSAQWADRTAAEDAVAAAQAAVDCGDAVCAPASMYAYLAIRNYDTDDTMRYEVHQSCDSCVVQSLGSGRS